MREKAGREGVNVAERNDYKQRVRDFYCGHPLEGSFRRKRNIRAVERNMNDYS